MTLEELSSIPYIIAEIKALQLELEELRQQNFYKANIITDMPRGGQGKEQPFTYINSVIRLEKMIQDKINCLECRRLEIEVFIEGIEDTLERTIVRLRCINNMTWEEIGEEVGYSRKGVYEIFKKFTKRYIT